jgi:hypothetical protein
VEPLRRALERSPDLDVDVVQWPDRLYTLA